MSIVCVLESNGINPDLAGRCRQFALCKVHLLGCLVYPRYA